MLKYKLGDTVYGVPDYSHGIFYGRIIDTEKYCRCYTVRHNEDKVDGTIRVSEAQLFVTKPEAKLFLKNRLITLVIQKTEEIKQLQETYDKLVLYNFEG